MCNHKFGLFVPGWPLDDFPNGIVSYVENLVQGLAENKTPVVIVSGKVKSHVDFDGLINVSYPKKTTGEKILGKISRMVDAAFLDDFEVRMRSKNYALAIENAIKKSSCNFDLFEIEESFGYAYYLQRSFDFPVVTRLHGPWFLHGPLLKKDRNKEYNERVRLEGKGISISRAITSPSLDVLNRTREFYQLDLPEAKVIPNPVKETPDEKKWKYNEEEQVILFVGRFDLHKGGDILIKAFRQVALYNKEVKLVFIGPDRGVVCEGVFYNAQSYINKFIPEACIRKRMLLLGHQTSNSIAEYRKKSTITVVASRYENFSISLLEAISAGCPVVVSNVGGNPEIVEDGYNGLLFESESYEDLAGKINKILNSRVDLERFSRNSIKKCNDCFLPDTVAKKTLDFYQTLIHNQ